ncbi:hypothetical protein BD779DRAFT_1786575 [Infundibulicybe gibba]|nr:hypothetical protein BD779DRAFT_1786575 [Infundibulicybe gibba]
MIVTGQTWQQGIFSQIFFGHGLRMRNPYKLRRQSNRSKCPKFASRRNMVLLARTTVAEAATAINAATTFIQYTLGLAFVVLLAYVIPPANTAIAWTSIANTLHSSLWPKLLRTDSTRSRGTDWRVSGISGLTFFVGVLLAVTGVVTPLGLKVGPSLPTSSAKLVNASYIPDTSPIGLATPPHDRYSYSRVCGGAGPVPCPGNGNNGNTSQIAPSVMNIFSSTPYGPFGMQFRQYYQGMSGYNYSTLNAPQLTIFQSLILRDDIFAVEGLIVDLSTETPGVGFWNHTLPESTHGGEWSQDILWLEPVTTCVNSNLTIEYTMKNGFVDRVNLTDRGGFVHLTQDYPTISRNGQNGNLYDHAFRGAALSNNFTMVSLNLTREQSYVGRSFPLKLNLSSFSAVRFAAGKMGPIDLDYMSNGTASSSIVSLGFNLHLLCAGYGGGDKPNITTTGIHCGMFAGTPRRSDGGDSRSLDDNSTWTQSLHACASVTRARIQTITFSFDGQPDLSNLHITRRNTSKPILWATERASVSISDVDLFWGHVDDSYEGDPSLSTIRSEVFYVPAGGSDYWGVIGAGCPNTVPAAAWATSYTPPIGTNDGPIAIYSGQGNYALLQKFGSLIGNDSINGPARIQNLIWTDLLANNIVGNATSNQLTFTPFQPSTSYHLVFAIPAILLFAIWLLAFLAAAFILTSRSLTISHLRDLIDHTSVGRVVVGDSRLTLIHKGPPAAENDSTSSIELSHPPMVENHSTHTDDTARPPSISTDSRPWSQTAGLSLVKFSATQPADY